VDAPHLQPPSALAAAMGPREAVQAATILRAPVLVPMHYGASLPGLYREVEDALAQLEATGRRVVTLRPGETLDVPAAGPALAT